MADINTLTPRATLVCGTAYRVRYDSTLQISTRYACKIRMYSNHIDSSGILTFFAPASVRVARAWSAAGNYMPDLSVESESVEAADIWKRLVAEGESEAEAGGGLHSITPRLVGFDILLGSN